MPIHKSHGVDMVSPDFSLSEKYWPILSSYVEQNFGTDEISDPEIVQYILKNCFKILENEFIQLLESNPKASFILYVHYFHENSLELWEKQISGIRLNIDEATFAGTRRVLKIILEQGCRLNLIGTPNFIKEASKNKYEYLELLENLLYVGYWAFVISEYIAKSQLFPKSIFICADDNELKILIKPPYDHLFYYIGEDMPRHNSNVIFDNEVVIKFKNILKRDLGLDYDVIASITNHQIDFPMARMTVMKVDKIISSIVDETGYKKENLQQFYAGLTVNKDNCLPFEGCILKNQDINRHTYRPILELNVQNENFYILGRQKWMESLTLITTNAIPYGICPDEWKIHKPIKDFVLSTGNSHEKILIDALIALLEKYNYPFSANIEHFCKRKGDCINIAKMKGVGEIDLIYLDTQNRLIYVCECKHNRMRMDFNNWKRDYSNFKDSYENQLEKKVDYVNQNINVVSEHFSICYELEDDLSSYQVKGIFLINAPTMYMYNGKFRAITLTDFENLLLGQFEDVIFHFTNEDTGEEIYVEHPYFDNLSRLLNE